VQALGGGYADPPGWLFESDADRVKRRNDAIEFYRHTDKWTNRLIALLMTTDPGDLVLDITYGSGTTACVAEQWGCRWITCETSRIAITLAKKQLMTAVFDYYSLARPELGVSGGFVYKPVPPPPPPITFKSIACNEPPEQETL
jgi:hypothetical protein